MSAIRCLGFRMMSATRFWCIAFPNLEVEGRLGLVEHGNLLDGSGSPAIVESL